MLMKLNAYGEKELLQEYNTFTSSIITQDNKYMVTGNFYIGSMGHLPLEVQSQFRIRQHLYPSPCLPQPLSLFHRQRYH